MVKVKICGLTNLEDTFAAIDCGADAIGFIFAPSPRQVAPEVAREIVAKLPPFVTKVGVFVNSKRSEVRRIMLLCGLDIAQLHGDEGTTFCASLFPKVIKTFTPKSLPTLPELNRYKVALYMLDREKGEDTQPEKLWPIAKEIGAYGRVILAGGLTPENVAQAIKIAQPYAVDVASGVEEEPGKKDYARMQAFIKTAKKESLN